METESRRSSERVSDRTSSLCLMEASLPVGVFLSAFLPRGSPCALSRSREALLVATTLTRDAGVWL